MGAPVDISDQRFGRLLAIRFVDVGPRGRIWEFRCDCGNLVRDAAATVRFGSRQSCGCLARDLSSARKRMDLTGLRVGRLLVKQCLGQDRHEQLRWLCECDCGRATRVYSSSLKNRRVQSCGCLQREVARKIGDRSRKENPVSQTKQYRSDLRKRLRLDPSKAMSERLSRLMALALKGIGSLKTSPTFRMVGYTPDDLRMHIERQFTGGMSWENRSEWQLDHIVPISTAKTEEDVIALNQLSNLRPLWAAKNREKRNRRLSLL